MAVEDVQPSGLGETRFKKRYALAIFILLCLSTIPLYHPFQALSSRQIGGKGITAPHKGHAHHSFHKPDILTATKPTPFPLPALVTLLEARLKVVSSDDTDSIKRLREILDLPVQRPSSPPPSLHKKEDASMTPPAPVVSAKNPVVPNPQPTLAPLLPSTIACTLAPDGSDICEHTQLGKPCPVS